MNRAMELRQELEKVQQRRIQLQEEIRQIELRCKHRWGDTEYCPIIHPAVSSIGDHPGRMGVDRQLPGYYPAVTIPQWKRACLECGMPEFTTVSEPVVSAHKPKFGSG